jgi:hypothetical protein
MKSKTGVSVLHVFRIALPIALLCAIWSDALAERVSNNESGKCWLARAAVASAVRAYVTESRAPLSVPTIDQLVADGWLPTLPKCPSGGSFTICVQSGSPLGHQYEAEDQFSSWLASSKPEAASFLNSVFVVCDGHAGASSIRSLPTIIEDTRLDGEIARSRETAGAEEDTSDDERSARRCRASLEEIALAVNQFVQDTLAADPKGALVLSLKVLLERGYLTELPACPDGGELGMFLASFNEQNGYIVKLDCPKHGHSLKIHIRKRKG